MMAFLIEVQRSIYAALTNDITAYSTSRDITALLAVLPLGIVFGAAHALTPGHSKSVLAAYILGSGLKPSRAFLTSFVLSVTHITSAVLLALITNSLVTRSLVGAGRAPSIEWASRLILVAIGLWLIFRAIRARPHVRGEGIATGFIAGLIFFASPKLFAANNLDKQINDFSKSVTDQVGARFPMPTRPALGGKVFPYKWKRFKRLQESEGHLHVCAFVSFQTNFFERIFRFIFDQKYPGT